MSLYGSDYYLSLVEDWEDSLDPPVIEQHEGIYVVRDDLIEAGSKARFADKLIRDSPHTEFVYGGSNKVGWGNISMAWLCRKYNKKAVSFWAKRKELTAHQKKYVDLGGIIEWVNMGMLSVTKSRAKKYAAADPQNRLNVPIGLEHDTVFGAIIKVARNLPIKPDVVWSVGSSGTLTRGLQMAWPDAEFHCVQTGHAMDQSEAGKAYIHEVRYKFDKSVKEKERPPFPSASEYDAKVWKPMIDYHDKSKINLFWNVAGDP